ncbi:MAG: histidine kinase [Bacteroidales bacterium]|nr:histidine kinase [Bacteroidales bacterium]
MINRELHFISKLSSYSLKSTALRIIMVGCTGFVFLFFATTITLDSSTMPVSAKEYIRVVILFILISEANVLLDNVSERFLPIPEKIGLRIVLHIFVSTMMAWLSILYFEKLVGYENLLNERMTRLMIALGVIFILILIIVSIGIRITEKWLRSDHELETLKQAKLQSDYNTLQEQLNPHFLFNNLSVLKSMIIYNPETAVDFVQNFTDVYRYVLQCREKTTVLLSEELAFIHSYIAVHKERLGDNLAVSFQIENAAMQLRLPALALQILVENALKHNVAGKPNVLSIEIEAKNDKLTVTNNFQPKESGYSSKNGLKNLVNRYAFLTEKKVEIDNNGRTFIVTIPLI